MPNIRTGPRFLLALLMTLAAAGCEKGGEPSFDGGSATEHFAYTTHDAIIPVLDGPENDHPVNIDARLYLPENASAATPQPAILVTHGFGNNKLSAEVVATADYFARHGYIVLSYSAQGFGQSSGCIRLDSFDYDVKDAIGLMDRVLDDPQFRLHGLAVQALVARDEKGALVGLIGGSYGGGVMLNLAAVDPRVRAIVPGRTWNSLQYALLPNNLIDPDALHALDHQRDRQGVFKAEWTSLLFALGNSQPAQGNGGCPQEKLAAGEPGEIAGLPCTGFPSDFCQVYASILATGDADEAALHLVRNSSIASKMDQLRVPTMLVQGQPDTIFNINDASANYLALKQAGVPVAMIWNSAGHGGYFSQAGECELYGGNIAMVADGCYLPDRALRWFERWLRGQRGIDTGPEFAWYQDWLTYDESGSAASQYGQADAFPAQQMRRFYLSGSNQLVNSRAAIVPGIASMIKPASGLPASYSETSNYSSPDASPSFAELPPSDPPGQAVSFTSAPFERAVESVGIPRAHLNIGHSNGQDLVFFGKVFDVAPDGTAELIHRLIAPVRAPDSALDQAIDIHLIGFVHRFAAGHSVRLSLASTDLTSYNSGVPDTIRINSGGADPAYFDLPTD